MAWKAVYCMFSEEHTLMFGTDVLNKKSMVGQVRERFTKGRSQLSGDIFEKYQQRNQYLLNLVGQVRERFRKGRSQEMEIFWKESTAKSVPFFRVFARYKQAFFTSIPNSGINCVKIYIFKHYSRMTSVLGPGKLTKSIDLERQVSNSDFCVPFHLLFFFIDPHGSDIAWRSLYLGSHSDRQVLSFRIFIYFFQISRKWTEHSYFLAKMLAKFTWLFLFRQNFHDNNYIFAQKPIFSFYRAHLLLSCAYYRENFCENGQVEKTLKENKSVHEICQNLKTSIFFLKWSFVSQVVEAFPFREFFCHFHKR